MNSSSILDLQNIRNIAIQHHKNQTYGSHLYDYHLDMVANIAKEFNLSDEYIAAAYLHDMIEDCGVTKEYIQSISNENIANMVWAVSGEGSNRKEKKQNMIQKIKHYPNSINLKMIDRLANMRESLANAPDKLKMYIKELDDYLELFSLGNQQLYTEFLKFKTLDHSLKQKKRF